MADSVSTARAYSSTNKDAAMKALKKKKRLRKQLETTSGALSSLEAKRDALEGATMNADIVRTIGLGATALKCRLREY